MSQLILSLLAGNFTVHRLPANANVPDAALNSSFFAITRTYDELSIVLPDTVKIESEASETGWACFKVEGPLDFSLVGILAAISNALAEAGISLFALSTFDTDYVLVKWKQVEVARKAFTSAGYIVRD